jgi:peptide/nickel transport system ATP-binding protein
MTELLLEVEDLTVTFGSDAGRVQVLDHVAFDMRRGEIVGLVGESGSGKTTLARAILGILASNAARIESGAIRFDGEDLLKADAEDIATRVRGRVITFVPQDPFTSFNPVFTIGSQIMELMKWKSPLATPSKRMWRYPRARRRVDRGRVLELLKTVQLPDPDAILAKYPHEVSGGQRQRLMIAMALLTEPKLIIADEPTTALDVTIQAQILKLLRRLARERGVSVLFTTHDLGAAHEICDRITVLYAGQEVESAPADRFFAEPSHPYTRSLLDSLPSRERGIQGIPGEIPLLVDPPSGCRFHPRCAYATSQCAAARPATTSVSSQHTLRCYHPLHHHAAAAKVVS